MTSEQIATRESPNLRSIGRIKAMKIKFLEVCSNQWNGEIRSNRSAPKDRSINRNPRRSTMRDLSERARPCANKEFVFFFFSFVPPFFWFFPLIVCSLFVSLIRGLQCYLYIVFRSDLGIFREERVATSLPPLSTLRFHFRADGVNICQLEPWILKIIRVSQSSKIVTMPSPFVDCGTCVIYW